MFKSDLLKMLNVFFCLFTHLGFCLFCSFQHLQEYYFAAGFERPGVMKCEESIRHFHVPALQCVFERMRQSEWAEPARINEALMSLLAWCKLVWNACVHVRPAFVSLLLRVKSSELCTIYKLFFASA